MKRSLSAALIALCLHASPAAAADAVQLSCPRDALSEAQRAGLAEAARNMVPMSDPRIVALTNALAECARRHGWSGDAAELARRYHLSAALIDGVRPRLIAGGVELAELEQAIVADDVLIASIQSAADGGAVASVIDRHSDLVLRAIGHRMETLGEAFGAFLGAFSIREAARRSFIAA